MIVMSGAASNTAEATWPNDQSVKPVNEASRPIFSGRYMVPINRIIPYKKATINQTT